MHETIIAQNIVAEAQKQGTVTDIYLELGELGHVPPQELVECIKTLQPEWNVHFEEIPSKAKCSCGFQGHPDVLERGHDHFIVECPKCKEMPEIISGTEFKIVKVVVK